MANKAKISSGENWFF